VAQKNPKIDRSLIQRTSPSPNRKNFVYRALGLIMGQWMELRQNSCKKITYQTLSISIFSFFGTVQATCPNPQTNCPNPNVVQGYLGNLGTTAGNSHPTPLPPLCAFGSLTINQNSPLATINRLNCTQLPTTNNFQLFQNPCAINQNTWTNDPTTGIPAGAGSFRMRHGPFLIGMARTGPVATVAQFNFNANAVLPNITADNRMTFFFSASEATTAFFNITTNVVNSETCIVTYTPNNGAPGTLIDYNIMGNVFHDVFYNNLTPALGISNPLFTPDGSNFLFSIDGNPVTSVPFGATVTGNSFQIFVNRYNPLGPATFLLYAVNANNSPITFTVSTAANDNMVFTATTPYTGFLRLASLSTNDPNPTAGTIWTQQTFFMPEDVCDAADTSVPANFMPPSGCVQGTTISPCPIESTTCPLSPMSENWWKTAQVDALSTTGMSFYMLLPTGSAAMPGWAPLFSQLAVKTIGAHWTNTTGTIQFPTSQALTCILPALALADGLNSPPTAVATGYYNDFINAMGFIPPSLNPPFTNGCDFSTNFFVVQFDMFMASNLASDIRSFQSANRGLPSYTLTAPVNNIAVYTAASRYVPVRADINTTATSLTWTYTPSTDVPPPPGPFTPLICFPFWKFLQGTTSGVVNTTPGSGQPLQNFVLNDTIKGTLYTASAINGTFTFLEGGIPSWYGAAGAFGPIDLFIPSTLTFTPTQITALQTALTQIQQTIPPLPYFPETFLDAAYNAGKTCFMLAKSALYIAYFMQQNGSSTSQIIAQTKPFADNAKSCLTAYLLGRTPGSSFFIADRTCGGICVNGAGGQGDWATGPNLQQFSSTTPAAETDSGFDFGNYIYNDHHFFAGYFLLAAAMVTNWDMIYNPSQLWINLPVLGADKTNQIYKIRDMIDFLWRDTHNPFTNDPTQPIFDPDLPYDRYGLPWEGHGVANGLQYQPNSLGRNQESISEDFNCWLGMNTFAKLVLLTSLTAQETPRYQRLHDFSLMNLKLNASSGIQWYKNYNFWTPINRFFTTPTFLGPSIYIGQFTQATVTNGQVNDQSAQNQTFF
jgi:hypothetical protein